MSPNTNSLILTLMGIFTLSGNGSETGTGNANKTVGDINSAIHQSTGSPFHSFCPIFAWYYSCEGKNGHIPPMGKWPLGAVASGGLPAAGLVNSTVSLTPYPGSGVMRKLPTVPYNSFVPIPCLGLVSNSVNTPRV